MFRGNRQYGKWVDLKGLFDTVESDLTYEKQRKVGVDMLQRWVEPRAAERGTRTIRYALFWWWEVYQSTSWRIIF